MQMFGHLHCQSYNRAIAITHGNITIPGSSRDQDSGYQQNQKPNDAETDSSKQPECTHITPPF
jgi:hypothetical protein